MVLELPSQEDQCPHLFDLITGPKPASKSEAEGGVMQEETFTVYILDNAPCVDIECYGVPTVFLVDTGC